MPSSPGFPKLSSLVDFSMLPSTLTFIGGGTSGGFSSLLNDLYYHNYQIVSSKDGATITIYIEVIANKRLAIDIPGTGFTILMNPSFTPTVGTSPWTTAPPMTKIPLEFTFSWGVLKYIRNFNVSTFDVNNPSSLFTSFFSFANLDDESILALATDQWNINGLGSLTSIANFATLSGVSIASATTPAEAIELIVAGVTASGGNIKSMLFANYILDTSSSSNTLDNLRRFLAPILGPTPFTMIKEIVTPRIIASLELSAGIQVPRTLLQPMKETSPGTWEVVSVSVYPKTTFLLGLGDVSFDSRSGNFRFNDNITLTFEPPYTKAQIGNTPFRISFGTARLQMEGPVTGSSYHNIISVDEATIEMPSPFTQTNTASGTRIKGTNLVFDTVSGFSGKLELHLGTDPHLQYTFVGGITVKLNSFSVTFVDNAITASSISGTMIIPSPFAGGTVLNITVSISTTGDGYELVVSSAAGIIVLDNGNVLLKLFQLKLGRNTSNVWRIGFQSSIENRSDIPGINKIFPKTFKVNNLLFKTDGSAPEWDIEAKWQSGTLIRGNNTTGLKAHFPVNMTDGMILLRGIQLNGTSGPGNMEFNLVFEGAGLNIGPVKAVADGLTATLKVATSPSGTSGALLVGPFDTFMKISGPKGIGIDIKASVISGKGYLYFDSPNGYYYGAFNLKVGSNFSVTGVGVIRTKNPDGSKTFSVLALVNVKFPAPIQIGLGFVLKGVGGLYGQNRDVNPDAIRRGVKEGTIHDIMFPDIDVRNVDKLIGNLEGCFPAKEDRHTFGIFFLIDYGPSKIMDLELGLILNVPSPVRLLIIGTLKLKLPDKEPKILEVNVAFAGIIDFDNKYISFDATIYDSKLLVYSLSGDIAVRIFWGNNKEMVVSIGGFHPAFHPAANLNLPANMQRITLSLVKESSKLQLTLSTYFAITSNTVQFGARIDLLYKFKVVMNLLITTVNVTFEIIGQLGFDILFQFNPFRFIADIYALLAVKVDGKEILSISAKLGLTGPKPIHAIGQATFKFLGMNQKFNLDQTWGEPATVGVLPGVAVFPIVRDAVQDVRNWQTSQPDNKLSYVNFKAIETTVFVLHPRGAFTVTQKVLPFGIKIQKYGNQVPSDGGVFNINQIKIGGTVSTLSDIKDSFAPAHFVDMNDADKLKAPSFEYLKAGVQAEFSNMWMGGAIIYKDVTYDNVIIDSTIRVQPPSSGQDHKLVNGFVKGGLISINQVTQNFITQNSKIVANVNTKPERHVLAAKDTLAVAGTYASRAEALTALQSTFSTISDTLLLMPK